MLLKDFHQYKQVYVQILHYYIHLNRSLYNIIIYYILSYTDGAYIGPVGLWAPWEK